LNNQATVTMGKSYGFRTYHVLDLALYHSLGKLPEPESTHDFFLTSQKICTPTRYSVLPVPYMRFSKVTVVRKRGFPNESREKRIILSWVGICSRFGGFSKQAPGAAA
jgi:hypothetical protein